MFGRKGDDLTVELPVTYPEAALGANVEVPTLNGPVTLKVPAGTPNGKTFRVRGKGAPKKGGHGDLLATVQRRRAGQALARGEAAAQAAAGSAEGFPTEAIGGGLMVERQDRNDDGGDRAVYMISVAAELAGVHPQTLRIYERKGLLRPKRTQGNTRRYSERDIELLQRIQALTQDAGINLAGVKLIMEMRAQMDELRRRDRGAAAQLAHRRAIAMTGRRTSGQMVPVRTVIRMPWQGEVSMTDVRLVRLRSADLDVMGRARKDWTTAMGYPDAFGPAEHAELVERIERSGEFDGTELVLGIQVDGRLVGEVQARQPRMGLPPGVFELGIDLFDEADRGRGFGRVALAQLLTRSVRAGRRAPRPAHDRRRQRCDAQAVRAPGLRVRRRDAELHAHRSTDRATTRCTR